MLRGGGCLVLACEWVTFEQGGEGESVEVSNLEKRWWGELGLISWAGGGDRVRVLRRKG